MVHSPFKPGARRSPDSSKTFKFPLYLRLFKLPNPRPLLTYAIYMNFNLSSLSNHSKNTSSHEHSKSKSRKLIVTGLLILDSKITSERCEESI